ncbi:hypothetical protein JTB14_031617 [Gonioctena quinquepunctata]|nr:hypothetical protein JTB14_031617 [Gonioctena quinquepunctata]
MSRKREIKLGLAEILKVNCDLNEKVDLADKLFTNYKFKTAGVVYAFTELIETNSYDGDILQKKIVVKLGPKWSIIMQEVSSESDAMKIMETHVPNVEVSNKFQALAEVEPIKIIEDQGITKEIKKAKPPPIIIKDEKNWPAISQLLRNTNSKPDRSFNDKDGIKMVFSKTETFDKCLQTLGHHKIDHFTFNKKNGNGIRAIFKGVAEEFSVEDITNDLKSKGFHPRVVERFKNRDGNPMSINLCIVPESDQYIKNLTMIMDINVKFEHQS